MFSPSRLSEILEQNICAALCTVIKTSGSTPLKAGAAMLVIADETCTGHIEGTIGGGNIEHQVRKQAVLNMAHSTNSCEKYHLTYDLGMCCGGSMTVFIESLRMKPPCIILGAGHVSKALASCATQAGFDVWVLDPRAELLKADRFVGCHLITDYDLEALNTAPFASDAFVLVMTHDHQKDQELIELCLQKKYRYLGMIASKRKSILMQERCLSKGYDKVLVDQIFSPVGLDIGAQSAEEIAVSIVAQMIQVKFQVKVADEN